MKKKIVIYQKSDISEVTVFLDTNSPAPQYWVNGSAFTEDELEELMENIQEAIQTANKRDW